MRKIIPWFHPEVGKAEKKYLFRVIDSQYLNDGDVTRSFENRIAKLLKVKHCVGVTNGTSAIALVLMALGITNKDEVIVPDLTFIATANAVRLAGAKVKLVDVSLDSLCIDVEKIKKAITLSTRAIVAVDVNGRACDYEMLESLVRSKGIHLICDSTEALGSKWNNKFLGTFGEAGCFSFSANKTITTGQGGMIATNNTVLYHRLLELKDQGRRKQGTGGDDIHPVLGFNFKLTNLQAAVGLAQLDRLYKRLEKSRKRDSWYKDLLNGIPQITFPKTRNGEITQWTDILVTDRHSIEMKLKKAKIGFRRFWLPLHKQVPYAAKDKGLENSILVSKRGLWLPSYFNLTYKEVSIVCDKIKESLNS